MIDAESDTEPGPAIGPRRPSEDLFRALDSSTPTAAGGGVPIVLEATDQVERVMLTGEGLIKVIITGPDIDRQVGRWATVPSGVRVGEPMPAHVEAKAVASLAGGPGATLAVLGAAFRFLIVRTGQDSMIWDLDGARDQSPELAFGWSATGRWIPRRRLLPVPVEVPWEGVHGLNGIPELGRATWLARPAGSSEPGRELVGEGGTSVRGDAEFELPLPSMKPGRGLPAGLVHGLERFIPAADPENAEFLEVLLRQPFTVRTTNGPVTAAFTVAGVGSEARFIDQTGAPISSPVVCTSGHAGQAERDQQCQYCGLIRCERCSIQCAGCTCCGIPICGSCATATHRCPACDTLTKIGVIAKRKWVKQHPNYAAGFTGHDRVHSVALLLVGGTVRRELNVRGYPVHDSVPVSTSAELRRQFGRWLPN